VVLTLPEVIRRHNIEKDIRVVLQLTRSISEPEGRVTVAGKTVAGNIMANFLVIKPTRYTDFTNLFCRETLHVSDSSSIHHQEFIHCTLSNGICHTGL